ncbi:39S ribosomal protein L20, mitochondrial isoform X1 [Panthera uncia]|uniref:39S ribosomal protein L20, mitochondrial isoform X1 n=1 Tax=Panthera uncia TaxID=29064 RepID=UPI0020FF9E3D|nr:39S ribosomal protein L20, mitochondrial isoform X1 [Panthera uncia]
MVFLGAPLWLRSRLTDRYWRVREVLQHARHFRGRKNRCYRLAVRAVTRAFVKCTKARGLKKRNMRTLWINRITAASQEHGLKYPAFIVNLIKVRLRTWSVEIYRKWPNWCGPVQWAAECQPPAEFSSWSFGKFRDSSRWLRLCLAGSRTGSRASGTRT